MTMKISTLFNALVFGPLLCGGYTVDAQLLSSSAPIVVQLEEIDRSNVYVHRTEKPFSGVRLSLLFRDLEQPKVEKMVRNGLVLHSSVWVMDGQRILVKSGLVGVAERWDKKGRSEYGFLLSFISTEEAEKAAAKLKPEPDSKEAEWKREK